jgi:malate dehydrogenase (oxaloacetate-decarboxylating)(NADP+)
LKGMKIIDPLQDLGKMDLYADILYKKRQRKGMTLGGAKRVLRDRNYFGSMMVELGEADALISGLTKDYASTIRPALQVIGTEKGVPKVAGMYMMLTKKGPIFFADTTVNIDPSVEDLVDIAVLVENSVKKFNIKPRIAFLSYSNFGSNPGTTPHKMQEAIAILHKKYPDMNVDGEIQGNFAINEELLKNNFPFSRLSGMGANTLIFPNLESGNIAYKLLQELGEAEAVGPILLGLSKSVHILQLDSSVREIVNMVNIAVVDAQTKTK